MLNRATSSYENTEIHKSKDVKQRTFQNLLKTIQTQKNQAKIRSGI